MNSKMFSNAPPHRMLLMSCFKAIITFVFQVLSALGWSKTNDIEIHPTLEKSVPVNLGELFVNYCEIKYLWKLLLLPVLLVLFRWQWLTAHFTGTENIMFLGLLLPWKKAVCIFCCLPQCLPQFYTHSHGCHLCTCRHCLLENSGFCEFLQIIPFNIQSQYLP